MSTEQKELKDYFHLYLGCEVWKEWDDEISKLTHQNIETLLGSKIGTIKPILRPLSDRTKDEKLEALKEWHNGIDVGDGKTICGYAAEIKFLLSKHFDLFGLIEANLAIDKTKIPV